MNNVFNNTTLYPFKAVQNTLAYSLSNKELKVFDRDCNSDWWETTDEIVNAVKEYSVARHIYFSMIGTEKNDWVFAPSMEGKLFFLKGTPVTVAKVVKAFDYPWERKTWEEFCIIPFYEEWDEYQDME